MAPQTLELERKYEGKRRPLNSRIAEADRAFEPSAVRGADVLFRRSRPRAALNAHAVIYRPSRSVMQSSAALPRHWVLEFEPRAPHRLDHLMGWSGSTDPLTQLRLRFSTGEEATAFARRNGLSFDVRTPAIARRRRRSYGDNFK